MDPDFPSMHLRTFVAVMFRHCPLLQGYTKEEEDRAFQAFMEYKTRVPVRGAIMLNERMDEVVLVKGWKKGSSWSFPRGKIDQDELDLTCAVREVYEETGYDLREAGLVGAEEEKSIEVQIRGQDIKMYVFRGIPMDIAFEPKTRKEISKVQWHRLSELPTVKMRKPQQQGHGDDLVGNANKYYMVAPFLGPLKRWIAQQKKKEKSRAGRSRNMTATSLMDTNNALSEQETMDEQAEREDTQPDHLQRLLSTLRQSGQAASSDLPEVSHVASEPPVADTREAQAEDLKAALFGRPMQVAQPPQTPYNQVIEEPPLPSSPRHHRTQHEAGLSAPPSFAMRQPSSHMGHAIPGHFSMAPGGIHPTQPQLRPIPPPANPVRIIPRTAAPVSSISIKDKIFPPTLKVNDLHTRPPSDTQSPIAPPASHLPAPKLNQHKAALLGLFKPQPSALPSKPEYKNLVSPAFEPPPMASSNQRQVFQHTPESVGLSGRAPSAHQAKLLEILRGPPSMVGPSTLAPPETAVELSASPKGQHSRNPSAEVEPTDNPRPPSKHAVLGQVKIQKRPQREQGPVSATVSGPLNTPQFDMIRSSSGEKGGSGNKQEPSKVSPVQILSRPTSSHAHLSSPSQMSTARSRNSSIKQKAKDSPPAPMSKILQLPELSHPSPKDPEPPAKPFQPQILRRPQKATEDNNVTAHQALNTPQNQQSTSRNPVPHDEHRKSLLSLFTRPSPIVSPASGAIKPTADISGIISPIEISAATPTASGQTNPLPNDIFKPAAATSKPPQLPGTLNARDAPPPETKRKFYAPDRMPQSLPTQSNAANGRVPNGASNASLLTAKKADTANVSTISPANQEYLLGFLKGLK